MTIRNHINGRELLATRTGSAQQDTVYPQVFSAAPPASRSGAAEIYLSDPAALKLVEFFDAKGLAAIKDEDQQEKWYEDWLAFQAAHQLYASVLSPRQYSSLGCSFDLLRYTRFLEVFAYCSAAHGYSVQVTSLGLFAILGGTNTALKQEAVAAMETGGLLAFAVSEKSHGSDLLGNEFTVRPTAPDRFIANGSKYYIGNSNCATMMSILARKSDERSNGHSRRVPVLFALRPSTAPGYRSIRKIRTLGVRAAFVGDLEVKDHELPAGDIIAEGRDAWDAVFGAITLGKFFLGFGSIGICEHALAEAITHLTGRILYGKPVIEMPHIRSMMGQAYARLTAMKLYAYRALDYVHSASATDRRYLLFTAVQKARVSTEGVKVMALLLECIGAKGFEADTYFEMALRDAQLIPGLEGSTHVNLALTAQFTERYLAHAAPDLPEPKSLVAGEEESKENPYLMAARAGAVHSIAFAHYLKAYRPLASIQNVRLFMRQASAFRLLTQAGRHHRAILADSEISLILAQCLATIAYAQLVAENAVHLDVAPQTVSAIFGMLVSDLLTSALTLAALPGLGAVNRTLARQLIVIPRKTTADWQFVTAKLLSAATAGHQPEQELRP